MTVFRVVINDKVFLQMVFGSIYNYLTGSAEEQVATTVPVRSVEPIDHDWELIETDSEKSQNETAELKPKEPSTNASRVQRRKNTKKINILVSSPNYNKFLKSETNIVTMGKVKSSKKQRQTNKTVNQPRSHKYQHRNKF